MICARASRRRSADVLLDRTRRAAALFRADYPDATALVVAGGVAANAYLRARLATLADELELRLIVPPPALCTDNGVMVAWAGLERLALGLTDDLAAPARARWPLDPPRSPPPAPASRLRGECGHARWNAYYDQND